jgi:hypothetical protein
MRMDIMKRSGLEEDDAGGLKEFIDRNENPGIFPQKTQQIAIIGHRDLLAADEIVIIVEIIIEKCHAQGQGQGQGQQEQRMFSQLLHAVFLPSGTLSNVIIFTAAAAVNGRFDPRRLTESTGNLMIKGDCLAGVVSLK